jgi:hypothetical protein
MDASDPVLQAFLLLLLVLTHPFLTTSLPHVSLLSFLICCHSYFPVHHPSGCVCCFPRRLLYDGQPQGFYFASNVNGLASCSASLSLILSLIQFSCLTSYSVLPSNTAAESDSRPSSCQCSNPNPQHHETIFPESGTLWSLRQHKLVILGSLS